MGWRFRLISWLLLGILWTTTFFNVCLNCHRYGLQGIICISYVTSVRYVAGINHEAGGHAVPSGLSDLFRQCTELQP